MEGKRLLLIDGHSILSRAFYGIPELTNSEGLHTNAVYGFLNILMKVLDTEGADYLAVAFDVHAPTFRHKLYEAYKGTRKPMPPELHEQVPLIQDMLRSMKVPILSMEGFEADDILGTAAALAVKQGLEVTIVSGDRDMLQLAAEHVKISIPKTAKGQTEIYSYYPKDVKAEWGVTPEEFIDLKALMGDSSDNIPGVPGMGPKTAQWIIEKYHCIEDAIEHALDPDFKVPRKPKAGQELLDHKESAVLSKTLARIKTDVPIEFRPEEAGTLEMFNEDSLAMVRRLEFKSFLKRFEESLKSLPDSRRDMELPEWKAVSDAYMAKIAFMDAGRQGCAAFSLCEGASGEGASGGDGPVLFFATADGRLYRFQGFDFSTPLRELSANADLFTLNLKEQLYGLSLEPDGRVWDLALAAYLINPLKDAYGYESLAGDFLKEDVPTEKELADQEKACAYGAVTALRCRDVVFAKLRELGEWELYREIEMPLVYTLYDMQKEGVLANRQALLDFGKELREGIERLTGEIYRECGEEFNINSTQQLGHILFEKMGLRGGRKTKTGYSTAADVLEKLSGEYKVVDDILQYRTLSKLNSTYAEGLLSCISEDGRIHGKFNQMVTATGRISSTDPNLQNIPVRTELGRRFRRIFEAKPGHVFLDADYSQVELRILASLSGDEKLIDAYRHADDIHAVTASQVFHVPLSEVTPQLRRNAKAVNFGIVYGISAFGLSEGLSISRKEAKEYIERYFETYPGVKRFLDEQVAFAREHGYVTTIFGRRRPVPDIKSSNFARRSFGERVAMNSPIQGAAADIMKKAMNAVNRTLRSGGYQARIVLQVHDELLVEAPESEAKDVLKLLVECMQGAANMNVPLLADAKEGRNWEEAH